jgi:hypothetical protein
MSEEEITMIEAEIESNRKLLDELKAKWDAWSKGQRSPAARLRLWVHPMER